MYYDRVHKVVGDNHSAGSVNDNLSIHHNKQIVEEAERNGRHMLNIFIVPSTGPTSISNLKKKDDDRKNKCFSSFFIPHEVVRYILMCKFYEAEACALQP